MRPVNAHCSYILPLARVREDPHEMLELLLYFRELAAAGCEVIVVDASSPSVHAEHQAAWGSTARVLRPDPACFGFDPKRACIDSGITAASHERLIVADDDVRYAPDDLSRVASMLDYYEMVRPRDYIRPGCRASTMEAVRTLVARAAQADQDSLATCALLRSARRRAGSTACVRAGPWDLLRDLAPRDVRLCSAEDVFIRRVMRADPERPRRASMAFLSILPLAVLLAVTLGMGAALTYASVLSAGMVVVALVGRCGGAGRVLPAWLALYAPLWLARESLSSLRALARTARRGLAAGRHVAVRPPTAGRI